MTISLLKFFAWFAKSLTIGFLEIKLFLKKIPYLCINKQG